MLPVHSVQTKTQSKHSTDTDIVVQLGPSFMRFIKRCGTEIRNGDAAACGQGDQEDQASFPLAQSVCEQLPTIERDLGKVHFTPVLTNTQRVSCMQKCKLCNTQYIIKV